MKKILPILMFTIFFLNACIKDDFVEDFIAPTIRITNSLQSLELGSDYQFEYAYFDNTGQKKTVPAVWSSADPAIVSISTNGMATAIDTGTTTLRIRFQDTTIDVVDSLQISVSDMTIINTPSERIGSLKTTSSYALKGDFTIKENADGSIELAFDNTYSASTALPGLYVYLSNNPNTTAGALEVSKVTTFSGAHSYMISNTGIMDYSHVLYYCKPFNVKVGDGKIN